MQGDCLISARGVQGTARSVIAEQHYLWLIRQSIERVAGKRAAENVFSERLLTEKADRLSEAVFKKTGRRVSRNEVLKAFYEKLLEVQQRERGNEFFSLKQPLFEQLFKQAAREVLRNAEPQKSFLARLMELIVSPLTGNLVFEDEVYLFADAVDSSPEITGLEKAKRDGTLEQVVERTRVVLRAASAQSGKKVELERSLVEAADDKVVEALALLKAESGRESNSAEKILKRIADCEKASARVRRKALKAIKREREIEYLLELQRQLATA
ncbi:hypothetical protein HY992_00790 [Candidatus Micrarchaeota archaeon]|nr:hypothetical protein [Candidatus Micrarchaeota archaeon]